ncbi:MAG: type II toxin-antitoxin system VapC family toxin [Acidimicrobiales bacterium]
MSTVLLDTHVLHWWSAEPDQVSDAATAVLESAEELAVSAISWYELAWLATHGRIPVAIPLRSWLDGLARAVRTIGVTPAIAATAARMPSSFPGDPADRLIYATAIERGCQLVTKDRRLRDHPFPRPVTVW